MEVAMPDIEAILTKPLDGDPIGAKRTFSKTEYDELLRLGAVSDGSAVPPVALKPVEDMTRPELEKLAIEAIRAEMASASDDVLRSTILRFREKLAAVAANPLSKMKVDELKALAVKEEIDLGDATKKDDIIVAIERGREAKGA
jgi:hypothetical protein